MSHKKLMVLTALSLLAFAANSVITRAALVNTNIDEASFIMIRVASGAGMLSLIVLLRKQSNIFNQGSWWGALWLFGYATTFTYGYGMVPAGTGALILFGAVQVCMIFVGYREGERIRLGQLLGVLLAMIGLSVLMLPGIEAPPLIGSILMCVSGITWGLYSLKGRGNSDPVAATASNFLRAAPLVIGLWLFSFPTHNLDSDGVTLALLSGIVTSALGYIIWYSALPALKASQAAIVQLSVPLIVAFGGIILLDEQITLRLILSAIAILGGTLLVLKLKQPV